APSASITDESITSGSSVSPCTSGTARRINSTSSASGSPTFTSSMSAPPATCCSTSVSMRERSPCCSSAWNFLRPVGLIRSPITQNGLPGPITTVLDGDSRTVSTHLPFLTGSDAEPLAEACDPGLLAKADQVQPAHARQAPGGVCELAAEREALGLGVGRALAALHDVGRHGDAGHVLVHEAEGARRADEADRRQDRDALGEAGLDGAPHERLERREVEADLELQEPGARALLLQGTVDAVVDRRRRRVLDRAEEEHRRRLERAAGEVAAVPHRLGRREQLDRVEIEDAPRLRLVPGRHVVAGEAADVLDSVQGGAGDVGLEREPVAVAADELHDRLDAELPERDR